MGNSQEGLDECREFLKEMISDKTVSKTICCLDNDTDVIGEIIGSSIMAYTTQEDSDDEMDLEVRKLLDKIIRFRNS
jgi:hypothetical protein